MRYSELIENTTDKQSLTAEEAWEIIRSQCRQALAVANHSDWKLLAYRGRMDSDVPEIFVGASPRNRTPQSTSRLFQQLIDDALYDYLGYGAAVRSNSIFVTGNRSQASGYASSFAQIYVIFPKDSAEFTWSDHVNDLIADYEIHKWTEYRSFEHLEEFEKFQQEVNAQPNLADDLDVEDLIEFLQQPHHLEFWWQPKNHERVQNLVFSLPAAALLIAQRTGLVNLLDSLKVISKSQTNKNLYEIGLARFDADKFIKHFRPQTGDWARALQSRNEIYLSGEYVAVREDRLSELMKLAGS
jgi:hypothetical protein